LQLTADSRVLVSPVWAISVAVAMPYIRYASAVTALEIRVLAFQGVWNVRMGMSDRTNRRNNRAREQQQDARAPGNVRGSRWTPVELHNRAKRVNACLLSNVHANCTAQSRSMHYVYDSYGALGEENSAFQSKINFYASLFYAPYNVHCESITGDADEILLTYIIR